MTWSSVEQFRAKTDRNVLRLQEEKKAGRKVVGQYCIYTPMELVLACDAIPVSLCGTKNDSIARAESILPRTLCPLIKSSFGFALEDSCPYLAASDLVVCDTTCDGKKKMFELLALRKPVYVLELPQRQDQDDLIFWRRQLALLKAKFEAFFQITISNQALWQAIALTRRFRAALQKVLDLARRKPSPLTGLELHEIAFRASFIPDYEERIDELERIAREIEASACPEQEGEGARILLTGVPTGLGSHKVIRILEECGARVVCIDNCSSYKRVRPDPEGEDDPLTLLAKRSLALPCAVMSPNPGRFTTVAKLARDFSVDGVCDLTWHGCQTYDVESYSLRHSVQEELSLPFLQIVTDYAEADGEQLRIRIQAFLEMLG
ncbi:MAG: 2-hydroxyacyl-CoA dehydratase family protein [Desulfovibrio sp.]|nr:2-hydroxyacyl-CoA dehydratase family protein [Desulfovibrio sp.]